MVAALMLSDLLSHVSFPVNVTLPSPSPILNSETVDR